MYNEKALSDTSIYKYTELMSNSGKLSNIIKNILDEKRGAIYVTEDQMEDVFYKIRHKSFNFQAKFAILQLFRKGIIRLIYNDKVKLTVAIPFFKYKMEDGGFGVVVNISNYAKLNHDGSISIDPLTLYCLMLSAVFSLTNSDSLLAYNGIPELYASLMVNVVSRMVNMNQTNKDKIRFVFTKFAYMQLGVQENRASEAAAKEIKYLDKYSIEQIDLAFPSTVYENLETLVDYMKKAFPEFESITFGLLFEKWMRAYGECTAFGVEYFPYFVNTFNALITNANAIANVKAIEKEANRNSKKLVMLFNRIEGTIMTMSQSR